MVEAARLFERTINDVLSGFRDLDQWNVQIVDVHRCNPFPASIAKRLPIATSEERPRIAPASRAHAATS
jgi:hypothetical protein